MQGSQTPLYNHDEGDGQRRAPCIACQKHHAVGLCPLKIAGVEYCGLCGLAHYGYQRTCPTFKSVSSCRTMLEALKQSPEPSTEIELAKKFLVGVIGDLQRRERQKEKKALQSNHQGHQGSATASTDPVTASQPVAGLHWQASSSTDDYARYLSNLSSANANGGSDIGRGGAGMPVVEGAPDGATLPEGGRPTGHP